IRYGVRSSISCCRLIPRVRRVLSRTCVLNLSRAFGAMRRSLPAFEMLNPRNLRSSGRATALFASLTFSRSFWVRNRLIEAITCSRTRRWSKPDSNPPSRSRGGSFSLRPVHADGIAAVPVQRGLAHLIKGAHAHGRRLRHLNDRAGVPLIEKIDERTARGVTLLADLPTGCQRALADLMIVHRPA